MRKGTVSTLAMKLCPEVPTDQMSWFVGNGGELAAVPYESGGPGGGYAALCGSTYATCGLATLYRVLIVVPGYIPKAGSCGARDRHLPRGDRCA